MEIKIPSPAAPAGQGEVVAPKETGALHLPSKAPPPRAPRKNEQLQEEKMVSRRGKNKAWSQRKKLEKISGSGIVARLEVLETKEEEEEEKQEEDKVDSIENGINSSVKTVCQAIEGDGPGEGEGEWVLLQDQRSKDSFYLNVCTGDAYWKPRQKAKRIVQRFDGDDMDEIWITLTVDKPLRPMFSAVQSPRSIRRRLRRLFIDNNPHGLVKVEGLLEQHLYNSQDELLHAVESASSTFSSESIDAFCATAEQGVRFASFAEQIRTDTSGRVVGCDLVKVKEAVVHPPSQPSQPRTKRKRRVKRMSRETKQLMFDWRQDLKPARKKKGMTLQHLQKLSKCRAACPVPEYSPSLPIWPPTEREEVLLAQRVFYSALETPPLKLSSSGAWKTKEATAEVSVQVEEDVEDQEVSFITSNRSGNDEHFTREFE